MNSSSSLDKPYIEKLSVLHNVQTFNCGELALNQFLTKYALQNQNSDSSVTYVAILHDVVIGYYSLAVGSVVHADAPGRITKGLAKYPIPVSILARLAVDKGQQKKGIGKGSIERLLKTCQCCCGYHGYSRITSSC